MPRRPPLHSVAALAVALLAAACGKTDTGPAMVGVQLDPVGPSVVAGRSLRLRAVASLSDGSRRLLPGTVTWSTSDAGVATVDGTGVARGVHEGTVLVSALDAASGLTGSVTLVVTAPVLETLAVSPTTTILPVGLSSAFSVEGHLSDGSVSPLGSGLTWSSSSSDVATVDVAGVVLARRRGDTTIRVSHAASGLGASATLTVSSAVVSRLDVTPAEASLATGLALQLSATAQLSDGTSAPLGAESLWSTSSADVATVDAAGLLQAVSPGRAEVTLTHGPTGVTATVAVTITSASLTRLAVSPAAPAVPLGDGVALLVTGHCSDGSSGPVVAGLTWAVTDPLVASVDSAGRACSLSEGTTDIAVTHGPSGLSDLVTLAVGRAVLRSLAMAPTEVTLAVGQLQRLNSELFTITGTFSNGQQYFLGPDPIVPISGPPFAWSTSDASIAQVDSSGRVTPLAPGVATITAQDKATGLTVASTVRVVPDVQVGVSVTPPAATLKFGELISLMASAIYLSGRGGFYVGSADAWTSSDPSVATVDFRGLVIARAPGTATVTFTDSSKGFAGSSVITVQ